MAHGLLEDDGEWRQCLQEASIIQTGRQLRQLFVTILRDCAPADPLLLWNQFCEHICDDLKHALEQKQMLPTEKMIYDYGLYLIDRSLGQSNKSLKDYPPMPIPLEDWDGMFGNRLIQEQRAYSRTEETQKANDRVLQFNADQKNAYDNIMASINQNQGSLFFLNGPAGTGKTFVYGALCSRLRGQGKIVLCVASSGIAALLLVGGRTAHSTFKIPLEIHNESICSFPKNSMLADLLRETDLIIWDEVPMQHKHAPECVD
jgi:hypothetical protein